MVSCLPQRHRREVKQEQLRLGSEIESPVSISCNDNRYTESENNLLQREMASNGGASDFQLRILDLNEKHK